MLKQQQSGNKDSYPHIADVLAGKSQKMNKCPAWHQAGRQVREPPQGASNAPSSVGWRLRATKATINNKAGAFPPHPLPPDSGAQRNASPRPSLQPPEDQIPTEQG